MLTHWKSGIRNATCHSHTLAIGRFHFLASLIDRFEVLIDRKSIKKNMQIGHRRRCMRMPTCGDAARGVEEIVRLKETALASATLRVD